MTSLSGVMSLSNRAALTEASVAQSMAVVLSRTSARYCRKILLFDQATFYSAFAVAVGAYTVVSCPVSRVVTTLITGRPSPSVWTSSLPT